MSNNYI